MSPTLFNGFILGWSVAWPPGPVNAEMIRRGLLPREQGGGFSVACRMGLGACTGDFIWAVAVTAGAGALLNRPLVRFALAIISGVLLLLLAFTFMRAAWKTVRNSTAGRAAVESSLKADSLNSVRRRISGNSYFLGLLFALSSPWNIGFWLAVVGSQQTMSTERSFLQSLTLAGAVVLGAVTWTIVLCSAVQSGARIFARPSWQIWTQALTAMVMLYFAAKLAIQISRW